MNRIMGYTNNDNYRVFLRADRNKLSSVIKYSSGVEVAIPINQDRSVKWFDDSKLLKSNH